MNAIEWDNKRNAQIFKVKISKAKSTLKKVFTSTKFDNLLMIKKKVTELPKKRISSLAYKLRCSPESNPQKNTHQQQQLLKNLLKEFGLQQYLRKFYELGYDDNNICKIGYLSMTELDDFIFSLKIFPGHRCKVISMFEKIKKIFDLEKEIYSYQPSKTTTRFPVAKKQQSYSGQQNYTGSNFNVPLIKRVSKTPTMSKHLAQTCRIYNTAPLKPIAPKSVENNKNRMIKSFVNGEGFGFNFYLNNNDDNAYPEISSNNKSGINSKKKDADQNINDEIDNLLKYYMKELNNKLEDDDLGDDSNSSLEEDVSDIINNNLHFIKTPKDSRLKKKESIEIEMERGREKEREHKFDKDSFSIDKQNYSDKNDLTNKISNIIKFYGKDSPSNFVNNSNTLHQILHNSEKSEKINLSINEKSSTEIEHEPNHVSMPILRNNHHIDNTLLGSINSSLSNRKDTSKIKEKSSTNNNNTLNKLPNDNITSEKESEVKKPVKVKEIIPLIKNDISIKEDSKIVAKEEGNSKEYVIRDISRNKENGNLSSSSTIQSVQANPNSNVSSIPIINNKISDNITPVNQVIPNINPYPLTIPPINPYPNINLSANLSHSLTKSPHDILYTQNDDIIVEDGIPKSEIQFSEISKKKSLNNFNLIKVDITDKNELLEELPNSQTINPNANLPNLNPISKPVSKLPQLSPINENFQLLETKEYVSNSDRIKKKKDISDMSPKKYGQLEPIQSTNARPVQSVEQAVSSSILPSMNNRYEEEDTDLNHIRINKSSEDKEIRQNLDQFDIEYMCRCLGLALMKHIETSKEKFHIIEILGVHEKFDFFNTIYNLNIDFFNTFYNLEAKMSNLEKIECQQNLEKIQYDEKIANKFKSPDDNIEFPKVLSQSELDSIIKKEEKIIKKEEITSGTFGHIKYDLNTKPSTYNNEVDRNKLKKIENLFDEIKTTPDTNFNIFDKDQQSDELEKEMQAINEYFKNNNDPKLQKYKNPKDLSLIKEEDSFDFIQKNNLMTNDTKKTSTKNNIDYINLLQTSVINFFGTDQNPDDPNPEFAEQDEENLDNLEIKENVSKSRVHASKDEDEIVEDTVAEEEITDDHFESEAIIDDEPEVVINKNNKFTNVNVASANKNESENLTEGNKNTEKDNSMVEEEIKDDVLDSQGNKQIEFESGNMESNYIIDIQDAERLKGYLYKLSEIYDDEYTYGSKTAIRKKFIAAPDPSTIFDFCANIMILTKMEKEVIIISLIYIERFIFNTGILINSRNWKRLVFTALIIASKIWDDDSFENNHFVQVFTHIKIGEINLLERTFLELINYKVFIKCSEYFKYFFIIKSIALKYNFNGLNLIPISVERMMKLQEYAYIAQKKFKRRYGLSNSATF